MSFNPYDEVSGGVSEDRAVSRRELFRHGAAAVGAAALGGVPAFAQAPAVA